MNLRERLKDGMLLLDGGTGTMLQRFGMPMGTIPETLNIEKPEWILRLHHGYLEAGSDIVYANTFGANRLKLQGTQYSVTELVGAAIRLAKEAAETFAGSKAGASGRKALAALDIGPLGQLLTPTGTLSFEEAYDLFAPFIDIAVSEVQNSGRLEYEQFLWGSLTIYGNISIKLIMEGCCSLCRIVLSDYKRLSFSKIFLNLFL